MRKLDYSPLQTRKPKHQPSSSSINGGETQIPITTTNSPKMAKKSLLKPTLATIFLIIFSFYAFSNTFFFSPTINPSDSTFPLTTATRSLLNSSPPPIKLYLYDLPRKFTYGVIENYLIARHDTDLKTIKYPGNQHSAEWFLFSDLIQGTKSDSVIRVLDPEEADLFYVPFFSSLSLVVNPPVRAGEEGVERVYSDEEMQESLVEWLEEQVYWKRNNGWDHVFICQDPNALYKIVDRVRNGILLVSDFGRLRGDQASLVKDVILPYSHRINPFNGDVGVDARKSLLFFMGNRYRKEGGKVRDLLFQVLENEEDVIIKHGTQSRESRRMATQGMHSSKFCLHPAGDTPSACRLFDAIVSLCIPVIVSDYVELPFEDVINYNKIAIFIDSNTAVQPGYLIEKLRKVSTKRILQYQQELKEVKHYFEYDDPNGTVKEIWRQVSTKVPHVKLMINREKRLVRRELIKPDCSCLCSNKTGPTSTF